MRQKKDQKIVVVYGDKTILSLIGVQLHAVKGVVVDLFQSSNDALAKVSWSKCQLLILADIMPKSNGLELTKAVQVREIKPKILAMILTGLHSDYTQELISRADDYQTIPHGSEELVAKAKKLLKLKD